MILCLTCGASLLPSKFAALFLKRSTKNVRELFLLKPSSCLGFSEAPDSQSPQGGNRNNRLEQWWAEGKRKILGCGQREMPGKSVKAHAQSQGKTLVLDQTQWNKLFFFFNICVGKPFPGSKDIELKIRPGPCL